MSIWTGVIIGTVGLAIWSLSKLSKAGNNIVTEIKGRIFSVDITQLTIAVDVKIKNPSNARVVIQYPFIKISHNDKLIASSELINKKITIEPLAQTEITNIKIPMQYLSMGSIATEFFKKLKDKKYPITLQVTVQTNIGLVGTSIPYTNTQNITF
jgi:hypothetical protein